jgi:multisubunit Na+/H+ antiporter MnhB subunit
MIKVAPLSGGFMVASMLGFLISILFVYPRWPSMGFAFTLVFAIGFVASMISMTYGPEETELAMDRRKKK